MWAMTPLHSVSQQKNQSFQKNLKRSEIDQSVNYSYKTIFAIKPFFNAITDFTPDFIVFFKQFIIFN